MMKRSMMQVFVKGSREALELYQKAIRWNSIFGKIKIEFIEESI